MRDYDLMALAAACVFGVIVAWLCTGSLLDRMRQREHRGTMRRMEKSAETREVAKARRDKRERETASAIIATDPAVRRATWKGDVAVSYSFDADGEISLHATDADALTGISAATRNALSALVHDRVRISGAADGGRPITATAEALERSATLRAARKAEDDERVAGLARTAAAHLARCGRHDEAKAILVQGGVAVEREGVASVPRFQHDGAR